MHESTSPSDAAMQLIAPGPTAQITRSTSRSVVADGDRGKAERLARGLADEFFAMREAVTSRFLALDEAIDRALAIADGPVVIADVSDNPGGGAPGDATFFLRRVLERGLSGVASGYYWDPMAVRAWPKPVSAPGSPCAWAAKAAWPQATLSILT